MDLGREFFPRAKAYTELVTLPFVGDPEIPPILLTKYWIEEISVFFFFPQP